MTTTQKKIKTKQCPRTMPCSTYKAGMLSWSSSSKQPRITAAPTGNCSGATPNQIGLLPVRELSSLATLPTPSCRARGAGRLWPWRMRILWQRVLQLGGKSDISLVVRVHNHLRFERVSCAQKMGFHHREKLHNTDWDEVAKNPDVLSKTTAD